jgi:NAD(P)-dependent dehydrogenase (short-subunit alcohol dehydrogenase family)
MMIGSPGCPDTHWAACPLLTDSCGPGPGASGLTFPLPAQIAIARGVAEAVAGTGITVNSVLPGPTESEGVARFVADLSRQRGVDRSVVEAAFFRMARPTSLLKRFATTEEVANLIVYVCSPLASATNGAALRADGGMVRAIV